MLAGSQQSKREGILQLRMDRLPEKGNTLKHGQPLSDLMLYA